MQFEQMIHEIKERKKYVLENLVKLADNNKFDTYWNNQLKLAESEDYFETYMVINWIGKKYKPKKILEIGTRTGGSLINLLSSYDTFENLEIYCFDLWREYYKTIFIKNIPLLRRLTKFIPHNVHLKMSINKVNKNFSIFKFPQEIFTFISGDSKVTVPYFFSKQPEEKFDYILVDGAHDKPTALTDLLNIGNHISSGGFLVFDDIGPESYKLIDVWERFKETFLNEFDFYEYYHRKGVAWAIKK